MGRRGLLLGVVSILALGVTSGARAASEVDTLVEQGRVALLEFLSDPKIIPTIKLYVQNAYGVLIVPNQLKLGFILGGAHGRGLLLARDTQSGAWSEPAIYDLYSGSVGLQIGGQASNAIYTIMNKAAVDKLVASTSFKIGADASGSIGRIGAAVGAGTTTNFGEDIYVFAQNEGLFGGLSIDGTVTVPLASWNKALYGREVTPREIVGGVVANPVSQPLKDTLAQF